jgi:tRNA modification GTPase
MGKIIKEGIRAAIIGRTNVGKSSLLNAILGEGRALVTSEPGTTRDTIEEAVDISGIPFTIIDTAGIRRAKSRSEKLGIKKTEAEIERADLLLLVIDGSQGLHRDENLLIKKVDRRKTIVVVNKNDFKQKKGLMMRLRGFKLISTSAIHSVGINELMNEMKKRLTTNKYYEKQECFFINNRHIMCLQKARESLQKSIESIKNNCDEEVIVIDIKGAVENLGEISGENVTEEIVEAIFSQFCVGK